MGSKDGTVKERVSQLFLLPEDEIELSAAILREYPGVVFLDESKWVDPETPPVKESILECGRIAGMWNREIYPVIHGHRRENGRVDGPELEVVQWLRSLTREPGVLHSGRWAYALPESTGSTMFTFVDRIWRILLSKTTNRMRRVSAANPNAPERGFRVGAAAFRQAEAGTLELAANALRLAPEAGYTWRT